MTPEVYDLVGYRVRVSAALPEARAAIREALGGFGPIESADSAAFSHFALERSAAVWQVQRDGAAIQVDSTLAGAIGALEWHLVAAAVDHRRDLFHLHGAALAIPSRDAAIALLGEAGSGKTTLTLALMARGFLPFADDVVLLDREDFRAQVFGRAFHVSDATRRLVQPAPLLAQPDDVCVPAGWSWPERWAATPLPVRWVLAIERRSDRLPALDVLTRAEAAAEILKHTTRLTSATRDAMTGAARLAERAVCRRLIVGDLSATAALVVDLVRHADGASSRDTHLG